MTKNLLITGGCGFIGSNFINYISDKYPGWHIVNIDAMYYCASINNISYNAQTSKNYKFIKGNINDADTIKSILIKYEITHIIHFAAQSHVDNSFDNSLQYTYDNVMGTHVLLDCVNNINKNIIFIHFSTDEVYGESNIGEAAKSEKSILCPTNPYAASKAAAEMYVNAYNKSYGLNSIIIRCNNVYGPNQYPEKLIPKFIKLLKENKLCPIHGDGSSLRSFIHVYDVCTAVDLILHKGVISNVYNIGSGANCEISVIDVAKLLINYIHNTDNYIEHIEYVADRPFNDKRYFITNDKICKLGWKQIKKFKTEIKHLT